MCPASYVDSQCKWLNTGGHTGWFWFLSQWFICVGAISRNSMLIAVGKLKMISNFPHIYDYPCSNMLTIDLASWIIFEKWEKIHYLLYSKRVVVLTMPDMYPYCNQWAMLWLICSLMFTHLQLHWLYFFMAIASELYPQSVSISSGKCCAMSWRIMAPTDFVMCYIIVIAVSLILCSKKF